MTLADRELARRSNDSIEVRAQPLRLRFRFTDLSCADSHLLRVNFACSVELAEHATGGDRYGSGRTFRAEPADGAGAQDAVRAGGALASAGIARSPREHFAR